DGPFRFRFQIAQWRNADALPRRNARAGLRPRAVKAHLAGSQKLLEPAMPECGIAPRKPAIEPHIRFIRRHRDQIDFHHAKIARITRSPAKSPRMESPTEASMYITASVGALRSASKTTSNEKAEKVVKPPSRPTVRKARHSGLALQIKAKAST